ncbi:hypothetical protein C7M84_003269 [Penaeus vannamei]|uniref:Uncharacterized protein n=1 Tax=Penaeus vannamei TaxID=6689 RepID=A0A423TNM0_PENVA|nr:hypothetical protein C7M84_003269 [Penaeus vannamei]
MNVGHFEPKHKVNVDNENAAGQQTFERPARTGTRCDRTGMTSKLFLGPRDSFAPPLLYPHLLFYLAPLADPPFPTLLSTSIQILPLPLAPFFLSLPPPPSTSPSLLLLISPLFSFSYPLLPSHLFAPCVILVTRSPPFASFTLTPITDPSPRDYATTPSPSPLSLPHNPSLFPRTFFRPIPSISSPPLHKTDPSSPTHNTFRDEATSFSLPPSSLPLLIFPFHPPSSSPPFLPPSLILDLPSVTLRKDLCDNLPPRLPPSPLGPGPPTLKKSEASLSARRPEARALEPQPLTGHNPPTEPPTPPPPSRVPTGPSLLTPTTNPPTPSPLRASLTPGPLTATPIPPPPLLRRVPNPSESHPAVSLAIGIPRPSFPSHLVPSLSFLLFSFLSFVPIPSPLPHTTPTQTPPYPYPPSSPTPYPPPPPTPPPAYIPFSSRVSSTSYGRQQTPALACLKVNAELVRAAAAARPGLECEPLGGGASVGAVRVRGEFVLAGLGEWAVSAWSQLSRPQDQVSTSRRR